MRDDWLDNTPWTVRLLPYLQGLQARGLIEVNVAVIHATELPTLAEARRYAEVIHYPGTQTGNSGHFYVDTDGQVECWVTPDRVAHHVKGHNHGSVGIELVHPGRYPDWYATDQQNWSLPYPDVQIEALVALLKQLQARLPRLHHIAGHDELDLTMVPASDDPTQTVRRKLDPGRTFPWAQVYDNTALSAYVRR